MFWNIFFEIGNQYGKFIKFSEGRRKTPPGVTITKLSGHTLYQFYASPACTDVRNAIYEMGIDLPMLNVLGDKKALHDLVTLGGKDQSPCLRIETPEGSKWMYESQNIIAYLKTKKP